MATLSLVGVVCGYVINIVHNKDIFVRKQECAKYLEQGKEYASSGDQSHYFLEELFIFYSPVRNTCVLAFTNNNLQSLHDRSYTLKDMLTGNPIFSDFSSLDSTGKTTAGEKYEAQLKELGYIRPN